MAIDSLTSLFLPSSGSTATTATGSSGFSDALSQMISSTDSSDATANQAISGMMNGTTDVHDAMIAMQKAEMTLELTVAVRNKLVQAYQDVMRMSI